MSKDWSNIAKVVYKRTYSRNDTGKLENWKETCGRVINGNIRNFIGTSLLEDNEVARLEYFLEERKSGPAGRGWWYSGSPSHARLGGAALNNCWGTTADNIENFVMSMDLLMLGGGVGMSIEHRYVSKLPKIKKDVIITHKNTKDADFIVPDSREGWLELFRRVLTSFFIDGKSFSYSTICIRAYGENIIGFGGKSGGPQPLIEFIEKISELLKQREGKHLRPIDALDLECCIGEVVVAGNIRRSALLILGDPWDKEYLTSKRWDLGPIPTQRAFANLSVVVDDTEDLHPLFWKTYEAGEPFGIVNRKNIQKFGRMGEKKKDSAVVVNPCQPGFAPVKIFKEEEFEDTIFSEIKIGDKIHTINGYVTISNKWSNGIKPVYSYSLDDGSIFIGTENHRVVCYHSGSVEFFKLEIETCYQTQTKILTVNGPAIVLKKTYLGDHEVFDITVDDKYHIYESGGVIVSNCAEATLEDAEPCNLQEIFLPNLNTPKEFFEASRLMHRWGKRVTMEKFHNLKNEEVVKRNRRVGTGITGCLQAPEFFNKDILDQAYKVIQKENSDYSKILNIPESIRTTVVKPSGTMSLMGDVTPGIHPSYSKYYIRRIRFSAQDPLIPLLIASGHNVEPVQKFDGTLDHNTLVVDFYQETPEGTPCADKEYDTWQQLDTLLFAQKYWADQAVSVTVYYKKEEISQIKEWLSNNLKYLKTISFLCHNDHGFKQAPLEAITLNQYEKGSKVKNIDINSIGQGDLESQECASGVCPIK